ncbi:MAG TPA: xylulokinase [Roseiarcus sp.]|nr:xylulokinase [Roseiarcus sp.]
MYLGLDCGTSGLKALLTDEGGEPIASASRTYSPDRPRPGWSEQNPDDWAAAMTGAIADLKDSAGGALGALKAIGFSGQMHGAVLLDRADRPIRPAILHNDGRAFLEAEELARDYPDLAKTVGVKPMPSFTGPKLKWIARNEPDCRRAVNALLSPKDYLRLKLGGDRASDMSDAAGTWLLDEARRAWSPQAFAACEADPDWAPPLFEGSAAAGKIRAEAADALGLPRGVLLAAGGGDAAAGAVGLGAIAPGEAFISLGTATQLIVATDRYMSAPDELVHAFAHALPNRWYAMAAMLNGAGALAFAGRLLGAPPDALEREAAADYPGPGALLFLPYLSGERTPLDDPYARGVLFGMSETMARADVARAVMEGVALTLADARDCLKLAGVEIERVGLIGGGAKSSAWTRMIAAATGFTVVRMKGGETGPAYGAARLARIAATGEPPEAVCLSPGVADVTEPDPALAERFARQRERFKALYTAVKPEFQR